MIDLMDTIHVGKYYNPTKGGMETALEQIAQTSHSLGNRAVCHVSISGAETASLSQQAGIWVRRLARLGIIWSAPIVPRFFTAHWWSKKRIPRLTCLHLPNPIPELGFLILGCPRPWTVFLHAVPVRQGGFGKLWFRVVTKTLLKRADRILVSDRGMLEIVPILRKENFTKKVRVIPFAQKSVPQLSPLPQAVAIGRLVPYKGYADLIAAWALAREQGAFLDFTLRILGNGPERENLVRLISQYRLESFVVLEGEVSDQRKEEVLRTSQFLIAPSKDTSETFGISVLEAFGYGLPVICSSIPGGLASLARKGECGGVFVPGDIKSLAQALLKFFSKKETWSVIGETNRLFCAEHFSEAVQASAVECLEAEFFAKPKAQLVFLGSEPPEDLMSGAKIRDAMMLSALTSFGDVQPLWRANYLEKRSVMDSLLSWSRSYAQGALSLELVQRLKTLYQPGSVLWVSQLSSAKYIPAAIQFGYRIIFDAHNVESDFLLTASTRFRDRLQAHATRRFERKVFRLADALSVVSEVDQSRAIRLTQGIFPEVIRNAIDESRSPSQIPSFAERAKSRNFLFVGTLDYFPNDQGLTWFCSEVIPAIKGIACSFNPVFRVCGTRPSRKLLQLMELNGVQYLGAPKNLEPVWNETFASFAPLLSGGGSRLKIPEALSWECPVVATTKAVEGLIELDSSGVLIGDSPKEFAEALIGLLNDPARAERLAYQGRDWVKRTHSWKSQESAIAHLLHSVQGELKK